MKHPPSKERLKTGRKGYLPAAKLSALVTSRIGSYKLCLQGMTIDIERACFPRKVLETTLLRIDGDISQ